MGPDDERHEAEEDHRVDEGLVAPERLACVVRNDLGDNPEGREYQNIDFRVRQEPEEMLPEERIAAPAVRPHLPAHNQPGGEEETRSCDPVHELENARRLKRRKRKEKQESRHK